MSTALKLVRYELRDASRSRWLIVYTLFFAVATELLVRFSGDDAKALLSLANVMLLVVPLASVMLGAMSLYAAREFTELLLAQPVKRMQLYIALFLGLAVPMSLAAAIGMTLPFMLHGIAPGATSALLLMCLVSSALTFTFVGLAFLIAIRTDDRVRGLGAALGVWLVSAVLYDVLVLLVVTFFAGHSIERPLLGLMLANPIDLARVLLLLHFDASALMGYTGAVFARFFGSAAGTAIAISALGVWMAIPVLLGARAFGRKDF
jgi:Cu-processing system permease protein